MLIEPNSFWFFCFICHIYSQKNSDFYFISDFPCDYALDENHSRNIPFKLSLYTQDANYLVCPSRSTLYPAPPCFLWGEADLQGYTKRLSCLLTFHWIQLMGSPGRRLGQGEESEWMWSTLSFSYSFNPGNCNSSFLTSPQGVVERNLHYPLSFPPPWSHLVNSLFIKPFLRCENPISF